MEITQEETYRLSETNGKENKNQAQESLTITFRDM